ncbi:T9SS type A sorting domain-containing protein [Polaribacter cellanae]|uniref:T9SS type A sorting domain-containing protein n=1 Tax=Polaribacter cellanae TaxID=2818493 RepID=A0A975CMR0_9FLAO|nr:T9SS type A sorting domain-containing protein [Polaribacter cellanae]QTE22174.1 T9SS type A sorting domain-containing protein [Polaribacter cellanae]
MLLLLIVSGVAQAQSFVLDNKDNQSHIGDLTGGDRLNIATTSFTDPNTKQVREWLFMSSTKGVFELGTLETFTYIFEKKNNTFIKRTTDNLRFLTFGSATFMNLDNDGYPDFANTGVDKFNASRTYVYRYKKDSLKLSQELDGVIKSAIAVIPHSNGDGLIFSGLMHEENIYKTKIVKNDPQNPGDLVEVFDGSGGVSGGAHVIDLMNTGKLIPNVHGTKNGNSFNHKFELQSDGTYIVSDVGLPTLEDGVSVYYDINRDGYLDWIAAGIVTTFSNNPRLILVYLNDGNGNFSQHQIIPCGDSMRIKLIDTDADGYKESLITMGKNWNGYRYDLVPFKIVDGKFQKWEHNPFDSESTITDFGRGFNNGKIIVTDMNSDGKDDVILLGRTTDSSASWGNYKAQLYLNTTTSLSVTDNFLSKETKIYPNPTSGNITIEVPAGSEIENITVYDVGGRLITTALNTKHLDMSAFTNGFYLLKFQTTDGTIGNKKFMKH